MDACSAIGRRLRIMVSTRVGSAARCDESRKEARHLLATVMAPFVSLDVGELDELVTWLRPVVCKAGELLVKTDALMRDLVLIREGLVRVYAIQPDGRQVNLRFLAAPNVAVSMTSLIQRTAAEEWIEAVTPLTGYRVSHEDLMRSERYERFMRLLAEQHYLSMERRVRMLQIPFARGRYAFFAAHVQPAIVAGMPDYHVASYLGVTPETLSRARRKLDVAT